MKGFGTGNKGANNMKKKLSEEHKRKIGEANKGNTAWLGKHHSDETKEKLKNIMYEQREMRRYGYSHHTYRKIVFEELGLDPVCEFCGAVKGICIHHEDKDKTNNCRGNVIVLCRSCHAMLHTNRGDYSTFKVSNQ